MSLLTSIVPALGRAARRESAADDAVATVRPRYEIRETDEAFGLTVGLPGVTRDNLELTAEDGEIRIVGRRSWKQPSGWTQLHRETSDAAFELVLSHEHAVNIDAIHAELRDGLLRVSLPKAEAVKPRKVPVS